MEWDKDVTTLTVVARRLLGELDIAQTMAQADPRNPGKATALFEAQRRFLTDGVEALRDCCEALEYLDLLHDAD